MACQKGAAVVPEAPEKMNRSSEPQLVQTLLSASSVQCSPNLACFTLCAVERTDSICLVTRHYLVVQPFLCAPSGSFMLRSSQAYLCAPLPFWSLWPIGMSNMRGVTHVALYREGVEVLMTDLQVPTDEFSYGQSKIFIRNPRTVLKTGMRQLSFS